MIFRHLLNMRSHPTWVRGLKPRLSHDPRQRVSSHPTWVRGLKQGAHLTSNRIAVSHPTWVRGLKRIVARLHQQKRA